MGKPEKFPEEFKQYLNRLIAFVRDETFHGEYNYAISWVYGEVGSDQDCSMLITVNGTYLYFHLDIGKLLLESWNKKEYAEIGRAVCHELCHLYTMPMQIPLLNMAESVNGPEWPKICREVCERQTQRISVFVFRYLKKVHGEFYLPSADLR